MTQIEIKQQLHEIKSLVEQGALNNKEIWTSADFMKYTGLSYSTLTKLTSTGEISYYKPTNGKLFFLKSEILDWIKNCRIFTNHDSENFIKNHKKNKKA